MKTIRDPRQGRLFDPFQGVISETGHKLIASGWQGVMRHCVLHHLPALRLDDMGRPSAELYAMCGLLLKLAGWNILRAACSQKMRGILKKLLGKSVFSFSICWESHAPEVATECFRSFRSACRNKPRLNR